MYFWPQLVSLSGNWIRFVALAWLVLQMQDSAALLGVIVGLQFLPTMLLAPFAGVIVDEVPKRLLISITQTIMGLGSVALACMVAFDFVSMPAIIAIILICGVANAFDLTARQTFVAELVEHDHMRNAVTLGALEGNLARLIGPTIGAICLAHFSMTLCFVLDAASYVIALVGMALLRPSEFYSATAPRHQVFGQLRESITYIQENALVRTILYMMALIGIMACEFFVTLPLLAKITFAGTAGTYAMMTIAMGTGSILGGLLVARKKVGSSLTVLIRYAMVLGISLSLIAVTHWLPLVLALLFVAGAALLMLTTSANTMMMLHTAPEMRGRMNGWWVLIFMGSTPIGGPLVGWIAQVSTPGFAIAVGGFACVLSAMWARKSHPMLAQAPLVAAQKQTS